MRLFIALLLLVLQPSKELQVAEDLQPQWKILSEGKLIDFHGQSAKAIYFSVDLNKSKEYFLQINAEDEFYLLINARLIAKGRHFMLNADSLREKFSKKIFVGIYQHKGVKQVTTKWTIYHTVGLYDNPPRQARSFTNFLMIALLVLTVFFTALLRNNPQLTLDYLNIVKLFSLKRRDDSQFVLRITSSVNLLFYFFCSLFTSLALIVASRFSERSILSIYADYGSEGGYFAQWFLFTLVIVALLLFKLGLAYLISLLFGWRDTAGFQFFNFIRLLVVSLLVIGAVSIFCFSINIDVDYYVLVKCFCVMLATGSVLMFFKLMSRESTSTFHLFSYLCATEIFPLVILIKVFLF